MSSNLFSFADNDTDISKRHLNKAEQIIKLDFYLRLHSYSYNYFRVKISLKLLVKPTQYFFTDHLNHKTVSKTTYRTLSANPR